MTTRTSHAPRSLRSAKGQSIIEFAIIMPIALLMTLGVVEIGYALLDHHVVTKLAREGSNLISRDVSLADAATALRTMSSSPVNFDDGSSRVIFSVLMRGAVTGTANYNQMILYQRYTYGSLPEASRINTAGAASYGPPDYTATNPNNNTGLRVTNLPAAVVNVPGGMVYVTEVFTRHELITPFDRLGVSVPNILYSIAYF
jgi:Flp pilus assembly protein TadG